MCAAETHPLTLSDDSTNNPATVVIELRKVKSDAEKFLDYLMPDWFEPEKNDTKVYGLRVKLPHQECIYGFKFMVIVRNILNNSEEKIFHQPCLRLIYQYLYELDRYNVMSQDIFEIGGSLSAEIAATIEVDDYKIKVLQALAVFWEEFKEVSSREDVTFSKDGSPNNSVNFFTLTMLLKGKQVIEFQTNFELFLEESAAKLGEYHKVALKHEVRLLFIIASTLDQTRNFIFQKFPYIEENSTIIRSFCDDQDFSIVNVSKFKTDRFNQITENPTACLGWTGWIDLDDKLSISEINWKEILKNVEAYDGVGERNFWTKINKCCRRRDSSQDELKRFIFGRHIHANEAYTISMFERILVTPKTSKLIELIWKKFGLSHKPEMLTKKNHLGKFLLDYVIASEDDQNLLTFLSSNASIGPNFQMKSTYLKTLSDQYLEITGNTLYERCFVVSLNDANRNEADKLEEKFFFQIFSLLEEIGCIKNIKNDVPIDVLLDLANASMSAQKRFIVDTLIGKIVAYWTKEDFRYRMYKNKIIKLSPFFPMVFAVLEGKQDNFIRNFRSNLARLEALYRNEPFYESLRTTFLFNLLLSATVNNQREIIDHILNYDGFSSVAIRVPSNMRTNETCQYVAKKLLESGHELGKNEIPAKWLPPKIFKEFLDSRLHYQNEELIELDCSFLLHELTKQCRVESKKDVNDKLIFCEDTKTLKLIVENELLNNFITHPVVSTYIDLKTIKYRWIFGLNILLFILFFVLPLILFIVGNLCKWKSGWFVFNNVVLTSALTGLIVREIIQYCIVGSWSLHWKKKSNRAELILIIVSLVTLSIFWTIEVLRTRYKVLYFWIDSDNSLSTTLSVFSVLTLGLTTIVLLTMLPFASMPVNMMMLKNVAATFAKFLLTFTLILATFTVSFCVFFQVKNKNTADGNETTTKATLETSTKDSLENTTQAKDDPTKNFLNFFYAAFKVILMLSGEYTIEPLTLTIIQFIFFAIFVISTFILWNLIQGLAFDDVQKLRKEAHFRTLKRNAQKFIETSEIFLKVYNQHYKERKENPSTLEKVKFYINEKFFYFSRPLINLSPFIHKLDKMYVNIKSKQIMMEVNRIHEEIGVELDEETFECIQEVISKTDH